MILFNAVIQMKVNGYTNKLKLNLSSLDCGVLEQHTSILKQQSQHKDPKLLLRCSLINFFYNPFPMPDCTSRKLDSVMQDVPSSTLPC